MSFLELITSTFLDNPYLSVLSFFVFTCIVFLLCKGGSRIVLVIIRRKRYLKKKIAEEKYRKDEERYRDRKKQTLLDMQKEAGKRASDSAKVAEQYGFMPLQDSRIVGIKEPIGKWTKFVTMQKMNYINTFKNLLNMKTKDGKNPRGFWQVLIHAKSLDKGHHKGRGV